VTTVARDEGAASGQGHGRTYVVLIGALELKYVESPVRAERILTDAGFTPATDYMLERLKGAQGPAEQEYQADEPVALDAEHARHFRAVPKGGGRS
jgi:hypothetical protein